ncbi:hypothetical protein Bbelb_208770 [Branchiostoma belcheri]|nr:hypothetical protein Bbelb_208770 [Branchiostoma belcheri]
MIRESVVRFHSLTDAPCDSRVMAAHLAPPLHLPPCRSTVIYLSLRYGPTVGPTPHLPVLTCERRALSPGSSPEICTYLRLWSSAHLKTQAIQTPGRTCCFLFSTPFSVDAVHNPPCILRRKWALGIQRTNRVRRTGKLAEVSGAGRPQAFPRAYSSASDTLVTGGLCDMCFMYVRRAYGGRRGFDLAPVVTRVGGEAGADCSSSRREAWALLKTAGLRFVELNGYRGRLIWMEAGALRRRAVIPAPPSIAFHDNYREKGTTFHRYISEGRSRPVLQPTPSTIAQRFSWMVTYAGSSGGVTAPGYAGKPKTNAALGFGLKSPPQNETWEKPEAKASTFGVKGRK